MADGPVNEAPYRLLRDVVFGEGVVVRSFANLYGCTIGDETSVGPFVEIQRGVTFGARCKFECHAFVCTGVEIDDEAFIGHGVVFINDKTPRATTAHGELETDEDWELLRTHVGRRASIGSGVVVMGGVTIGAEAMIGAGAVVTHDVEPGRVVAGVPARALRAAAGAR
jgi:UDP-2-acetamido-3-amino-2,3-dideoxy-glucuronate N-acetyltransferase